MIHFSRHFNPKNLIQWSLLGVVLATLIGVRWFVYVNIGFVNFDSSYNFLIAKEISCGNFNQLFNHASPLLHLINGLFYFIWPDYQALKLFHVFVSVIAVWVFSKVFQRIFDWNFNTMLQFLLLFGTSLFAVNSSHYVSLEPLSWLFFALLLNKILVEHSQVKIYEIAIYSSFLLLVNYKFCAVVMPVLVVIGIAFYGLKWLKVEFWICVKGILVFFIPIVLMVLFGMWIGKPWWLYPASVYVHAVERTIHPVLKVAHWNFDFTYYPRYFLEFEQPLLIPLLFVFISIKKFWNSVNVKQCLLFLTISLVGMFIVQKAPRGLLFCFPFLYAFALVPIFSIKNRISRLMLISGMLAWNGYTLNKNIWNYSYTNYPNMAKAIENNKIKSFSVTSSCLIAPYLEQTAKMKILKDQTDAITDSMQIKLFDGYAVIAGVGDLMPSSSENLDTLAYFLEPTLDAPMVWLESSEYNGWDYQETFDLKAKNGTGYLLLIKNNY